MQDYRLYVVIQVIASLGLLAQSGFFIFFLAWNLWPMVITHLFGMGIWIGTLLANRKGRYSLAVVLMAIEVAVHAIVANYFIGWDAGFHFYLFAAIPISFLNPGNR